MAYMKKTQKAENAAMPNEEAQMPNEAQDNIENTEESTPVQSEKPMSDEMKAILERLERLERENNELREGKMNVFVSWREVYDWPREYSYKLWWGIPVLSYKSFKKDPTKDLMFKDQFWQWKSNHYLKLTLANEKEVEVEVNEFNRDYERSEKMRAEKCTDNRWHLLGYEFETEDRWKIIVAENMIN